MSSIPQGRTAAFFGKAKLNTRYHGNSSFGQEHLVSYTEMLYKQQMSMRGPAAMVTVDGATNSKLHSRVDNYEAVVRFLSASLFCQFYGFVPRKALPSPEHYDVPDATPKVAIQTFAATLATFRSYPCDLSPSSPRRFSRTASTMSFPVARTAPYLRFFSRVVICTIPPICPLRSQLPYHDFRPLWTGLRSQTWRSNHLSTSFQMSPWSTLSHAIAHALL